MFLSYHFPYSVNLFNVFKVCLPNVHDGKYIIQFLLRCKKLSSKINLKFAKINQKVSNVPIKISRQTLHHSHKARTLYTYYANFLNYTLF